VGILWGSYAEIMVVICGDCMGIAWGLYGDCMGIVGGLYGECTYASSERFLVFNNLFNTDSSHVGYND
jgi:hypothetical protein